MTVALALAKCSKSRPETINSFGGNVRLVVVLGRIVLTFMILSFKSTGNTLKASNFVPIQIIYLKDSAACLSSRRNRAASLTTYFA